MQGPLGEVVTAKWGMLGDGMTAIIEMAEAPGITLLPSHKLNPLKTSTYGTGQLIKSAMDKGCKKITIGIGGSATNDGGAGMASALGVKFFDKNEVELEPGGGSLAVMYQGEIVETFTHWEREQLKHPYSQLLFDTMNKGQKIHRGWPIVSKSTLSM